MAGALLKGLLIVTVVGLARAGLSVVVVVPRATREARRIARLGRVSRLARRARLTAGNAYCRRGVYTRRSTISFFSSAMALAGLRPLGQALAQFMMVWQR